MSTLFALLLLVSLACFVIGLISPRAFNNLFKGSATRKKTSLAFGLATVICFIAFGATSPSATTQKNQPTPSTPQAMGSNSVSPTTAQPTPQPVVPTPATAQAPAPTPAAPSQQTLLSLTGSGSKSTKKFTTTSDWDLNWSYDCKKFGYSGNFQVMVYNEDGSLSYQNGLVNQLGKSGTDVQNYHTPGTFYLSINSECAWNIEVKQ